MPSERASRWDALISEAMAGSTFGNVSQLQVTKLVQALRTILAEIDGELTSARGDGPAPRGDTRKG
jgi:hypothetical protein